MSKRATRAKTGTTQCSRCHAHFPATPEGLLHLARCTAYNGHANYETFTVALWIDNEEPSYRYWREVAAECLAEADDDREEAARLLAERLKNEHQDAAADLLAPTVYSDLLGAALSEVDWLEVAENLMDS
jgi:hypothetical protein